MPEVQPGSDHPLQLVSGWRLRQVRFSPRACVHPTARPVSTFAHLGHYTYASEPAASSSSGCGGGSGGGGCVDPLRLQRRWGGCSGHFVAESNAEETEAAYGPRPWVYSRAEDLAGRDTAASGIVSYPPGGYVAVPLLAEVCSPRTFPERFSTVPSS